MQDAGGGQGVRERKIGRIGGPCDVGVAPFIHRDAIALVNEAAATQVSRVGQGQPAGPVVKTQLADEGVLEPSRALLGAGNGRTVGKLGEVVNPVT